MCIGLLRPAHTPKVKYSLSKLLLWLALCICVSGPAITAPREKYSLKAVIVACFVYLRFRTSTHSQREIFSQSCYCGLPLCICVSGPAHTPREKYSLKAVIVCLLCVFAFQDQQHTPQSEIFSLTAVIVTCSLCSCTVAFQDQHTLPKRNILSKLLLWLALCICISGPAHTPREKYSLKAVIVACSVYLHFRTSTHSQSEIFSLTAVIVTCSLCSCTVAFQDQHTLPKRNILSKLLLWLCSVYLHFRTSTPSQREIFSQSCYCGLLIWSFLSGPAQL